MRTRRIKYPAKLEQLKQLWFIQASKYRVFPVDSSLQLRLITPRPQLSAPRTKYVYYPGTGDGATATSGPGGTSASSHTSAYGAGGGAYHSGSAYGTTPGGGAYGARYSTGGYHYAPSYGASASYGYVR